MSTTTTNLGLIKPDVNSTTDADQWGGYLNTDLDDIDSEFAVSTINHDYADFVVSRAEVKDFSETTYNLGNISGAVAIDYTNGSVQYGTANGNITSITVSNWPATGKMGFLTLQIAQDGTGSRTLALSSAYKTIGGAGITLTTTASAVDEVYFRTRDNGTAIFTSANLNWS